MYFMYSENVVIFVKKARINQGICELICSKKKLGFLQENYSYCNVVVSKTCCFMIS
jgi:hypothetical protein